VSQQVMMPTCAILKYAYSAFTLLRSSLEHGTYLRWHA